MRRSVSRDQRVRACAVHRLRTDDCASAAISLLLELEATMGGATGRSARALSSRRISTMCTSSLQHTDCARLATHAMKAVPSSRLVLEWMSVLTCVPRLLGALTSRLGTMVPSGTASEKTACVRDTASTRTTRMKRSRCQTSRRPALPVLTGAVLPAGPRTTSTPPHLVGCRLPRNVWGQGTRLHSMETGNTLLVWLV